MKRVPVLVTDPSRLTRRAVRAALSSQPDVEFVSGIHGEPEILPASDRAHGTVRPTIQHRRTKKLSDASAPKVLSEGPMQNFGRSIQTGGRQNLVEEHEQVQF